MKRMLKIANKLYSDSPQLYEKGKQQSFLLNYTREADRAKESASSPPPLPGTKQVQSSNDISSKDGEKPGGGVRGAPEELPRGERDE